MLGGIRGSLLVAAALGAIALIGLLDYASGPYLSWSIFYLMPVAACAWWGGFPHGVLVAVAGAVSWHVVEHLHNSAIPPSAGVWNGCVRFGALTLVLSMVARLHAGVRRERRLARTDPLTGAANAHTFYEAAAAEVERARRTGRPLTLAYLDVDNFKQLNDRLGHAAGDHALIHIVQTIRFQLRGTDLLARLGGDEFALLVPEQAAAGSLALVRRLQAELSSEMARHGWPVTLSVGAITFLSPAWDIDQMIRRVDALMYAAKRKGKGRVEHAVVSGAQPEKEETHRLERRATTRILCRCPARVRSDDEGEVLATVCDISAGGVGLHLERPFPPDTILIVEPLRPGARTLLARVVHVTRDDRRWLHGCLLPTQLSAEELSDWLDTGSTAAADFPRFPSPSTTALET